jgi:hypothetical protein
MSSGNDGRNDGVFSDKCLNGIAVEDLETRFLDSNLVSSSFLKMTSFASSSDEEGYNHGILGWKFPDPDFFL